MLVSRPSTQSDRLLAKDQAGLGIVAVDSQEYRLILERELKAEPAPETQGFLRRIRARRPTSPETRLGGPARSQVSSARGQAHISAEAPLVGRSNEHLALVRAFRLARRGQFQVVSLEGEPGIGKTRLVKEFLVWTAGEGADVLPGRAYESNATLPYQPS